MRPLKLASTISTPELYYPDSTSSFAESIRKRETANIVEGYTITSDIPEEQMHKFYAEINIDNDRLWEVIRELVVNFPEEAALIYHHIDDEPTYGKYVSKYQLLNTLEKYKIELTQDGYLEFGIISHMKESFEEVFIKKAKYLQYWGMDKEAFVKIMQKQELYPVEGLNFMDEFPLQTEVLINHRDDVVETSDLIQILDGIYKEDHL